MIVMFLIYPKPYQATTFFIVGLSSIIGALGSFSINEAIIHGKAGPSQALCEIQASYMLVLEVLILGKMPNLMQVSGFAFGIVSVIVISRVKEGQ
eukprot:403355609